MKLPLRSGREVIKAFSKVGLYPTRQKGSHVLLKGLYKGELRTFPVPLAKELKKGTLQGIIKQAGMEVDEFLELL